jgi:cobalt/nickel transport system ATP-binding protein
MIFEVEDVSYSYDGVPAISGLSLRVAAGERVAVLGANGSGKSTLLRLLDGLCFPQAGAIRFDGEPLTEERLSHAEFRYSFRRRVGLVFQNPDVQLFNPTVFDEVAFGPLQLRWGQDRIRRGAAAALELMGVAHLRDRVPHHLSGGEKKRVALASVLVMEPDVLLLDEPTASLDPRSQSVMIDLLSAVHEQQRTIITATNDLGIVEDIADVCHVLETGAVTAAGTPEEILGDIPRLERAGLVHAHRHRHAGSIHSHPHLHGHRQHGH